MAMLVDGIALGLQIIVAVQQILVVESQVFLFFLGNHHSIFS